MRKRLCALVKSQTAYLSKMLEGFTDADLLLSTGESNTIGWILGHINLYRAQIIQRLNNNIPVNESERIFARGTAKNKQIQLCINDIMKEISERGSLIEKLINEAPESDLKKIVDIKFPAEDNSLESLLSFLIWHETIHIGQISLIKAAVYKK